MQSQDSAYQNHTVWLAGLEYLVRTLYFLEFARRPHPVEELRAYAEKVRIIAEQAGRATQEDGAIIAMQEYLNVFFARLSDELVKMPQRRR